MMKKTSLPCCALCQISSVSNGTTEAEFKSAIELLTVQKNNNTEVGISTGNGQTAAFVIVSPGEERLRKTLENVGFNYTHTFDRRKGYPAGRLDMYVINL